MKNIHMKVNRLNSSYIPKDFANQTPITYYQNTVQVLKESGVETNSEAVVQRIAVENQNLKNNIYFLFLKKFLFSIIGFLMKNYIHNLSAMLTRLEANLQQYQQLLSQFDIDQSLKALTTISIHKQEFISFESKMYDQNYLNDVEFKTRIRLITKLFYRIENDLKKKAFKNQKPIPMDKDLLDAICKKSKEAVYNTLYK